MSSRFPGGHCNTGTGHTPVTGTHPTQLSPLDRACWTPVPVSTNHIAPGALNPISVPVATVTGWISSAQRTRLRAPSGVAPAIGSSPASFMLILDEPIRRVNTLTVMDFQTAGRVWPITPDRHTNMLCMAPCSSEPLPPCAPECPTAATCCCGTTADCTAHTTEPDCEGECDDCEWSDTTGKCGTAWTTLCAPPMANPTLPEVLGWLQRQTPLGWEWVISPDGHAGVRAVAISTGPYTTASCGQPPISSQSFVFPSSDLQICFGGDRPLNPSLGWILGFRDRCYRFPAPAAAATLHLSLGHYYTTEPTSMHTVTLRWKCIRASPLAGLSASDHKGRRDADSGRPPRRSALRTVRTVATRCPRNVLLGRLPRRHAAHGGGASEPPGWAHGWRRRTRVPCVCGAAITGDRPAPTRPDTALHNRLEQHYPVHSKCDRHRLRYPHHGL